jgi:hypothetical protein
MEVDVKFLKPARQAGAASIVHVLDPLQIKAARPAVQSEEFFESLRNFVRILEQYLCTGHGS